MNKKLKIINFPQEENRKSVSFSPNVWVFPAKYSKPKQTVWQ
jgi:hypothetical protein